MVGTTAGWGCYPTPSSAGQRRDVDELDEAGRHHVYLFSAQREDAAELIARLGPQGHFQSGYSNLSELSGAVAEMKETHHFYPVLFYFRFPATYYSVSSISTVSLDAVSLILSALDQREYGWLQGSGAVTELWAASRLLITSLASTFLSRDAGDPSRGTPAPDLDIPATPDGNRIKLADQRGSPAVLVFYPGDFTPVCTGELGLFNELRRARRP